MGALTAIGLNGRNGDFRLNVGADEEVTRETDAEVRTPRGYVRMEVGLIGKGNAEVISDKVGRMDRNGVILMDLVGQDSAAYQTADQRGVKLIQLRNNNPVEELRQHLIRLNVPVYSNQLTAQEIENRICNMPIDNFDL